MIIDSIELPDLSEGAEAAFLHFESRLREALTDAQRIDRRDVSDQNGNYVGSYLPERYYGSILAFLDEFGLEIDVDDISDLPSSEFIESFSKFFNKVNYTRTRFALRKQRFQQGVAGTLIAKLKAKNEITDLIITIRKIVNQSVADERKKNAILRKLGALQEEIRSRPAPHRQCVQASCRCFKSGRQFAENLEPLVEKLERLKKVFFEAPRVRHIFPKPE